MQTPVSASEYYDVLPAADHHPGDVWSHLPTHGVLSGTQPASVVITPACDLVRRKAETVTYLPLVSVRSYLSSRSYLPDLIRRTQGQLAAAGLTIELHPELDGPIVSIQRLEAVSKTAAEHEAGSIGTKERAALQRAIAGLGLTSGILRGANSASAIENVKTLLGDREFAALTKQVVRNGYSSDIHFLPADEQPAAWTVLPEHSVALFRYPFSLPLDILDLAGTTSEDAWSSELRLHAGMYPCGTALAAKRPIKVLRVRRRFMSDLLTRFTSLYQRLGSPDFADATVHQYATQIGGTR